MTTENTVNAWRAIHSAARNALQAACPSFGRHTWMRPLVVATALCAAVALTGCGALREQPTYANSDGHRIDKPLTEVLGWMIASTANGLPKPPSEHVQGYAFPVVRDTQGTAPAKPGELSVTWIGHATALIRIDGLTVLTDPQFSERASPLTWTGPQRRTPLPYTLAELPRIDVVVVSHNHYDHLDEASVQALARQRGGPPLFVVPQGLDTWFRERGIGPVQAVGWWATHTHQGLTVTGVPAHHWSGRGLFDRNQSHWGGWVLRRGGLSAYFAGDSGYSRDFADIGQRLGPFDLALIPVGAYLPRDFMRDQHVDPTEAVRIHQDVRARRSVGIHWGTFELADEPLDAPMGAVPAALQAAGLAPDALQLLAHGQTLQLQSPIAP